MKDMAIIIFGIMATLSFICANKNAKENTSNVYAYRSANANTSVAVANTFQQTQKSLSKVAGTNTILMIT